jgi:hypothetical protein
VEFFGSHDYAWVQSSKVVAFHAAKDAPVRTSAAVGPR